MVFPKSKCSVTLLLWLPHIIEQVIMIWKNDFVYSVLSKIDILFLHEHWLSDKPCSILSSFNPTFLCTAISGFDNSRILCGRPFGGCAIFWRSGLNLKVGLSVLKIDNRRVCTIRAQNDKVKLLLVNVYMLYEDCESNSDEFSEHLLTIELLITEKTRWSCSYRRRL